MAVHISILGNIGSGKSTTASLIRRELSHFRYLSEPNVQEDPYLDLFRATPKTVALQHQVWFLVTALETISERINHTGDTVQDSSILACPIFAEAMVKCDWMEARDFILFEALCKEVIEYTPPLTIYIIVRASVETLLKRIHTRGRASETAIPREYLQILQELHDSKLVDYWIQRRGVKATSIDTEVTDLEDPIAAQRFIHYLQMELEKVQFSAGR